MLIINDNRAMSGAEKAVLKRLRGIQAPGIAVSGCHVPGRPVGGSARHVGQEVDVVLFTPAALVCIEVKGIVKYGVSGVLSCGVNGRWALPGIEGDPIHVRGNDSNPLEQLAGGMYGLKEIAETATGAEVFVPGLVVISPNKGTITLDKGTIPMPTGRDVILESELAGWLAGQSRRAQTWTAPGVFAVLDALGLADAVGYETVLGAGFDGPQPVEATVVDLFPAAPEPVDADAGPARASRFAAAPMPGTTQPATRPAGRSHMARALLLFAAVFCVLAVLIGVFSSGHGSGTHSGSHQPRPTTSAPAAPFAPFTPAPAPAVTTGAPAPLFPATTKPCYPFQPDC
ncbi:nuclease-related domain-containing protein [Nocardia vaccinii]|uniref:nuclease-related domain-containing protein n=1 Tax=Nocardia vaccinii TaxID=1822 RepID=UPI000AD3912C|nr:nuclease-related domain-containing protein [Nocardia vaccinii]